LLCTDLDAAREHKQPLCSERIQRVEAFGFYITSTHGDTAMILNRNRLSNNLMQTAYALSDLYDRDDGPALVSPRFGKALAFVAGNLETLGMLCHTDRWELLRGQSDFWRVVLGARVRTKRFA
jgi:hypothetical protein